MFFISCSRWFSVEKIERCPKRDMSPIQTLDELEYPNSPDGSIPISPRQWVACIQTF